MCRGVKMGRGVNMGREGSGEDGCKVSHDQFEEEG